MKSSDLLKIGILYKDLFGKRVINHLINKNNFCTRCGPLCINCRDNYSWFAGKIHYAYQIEEDDEEEIDEIFDGIKEKMTQLDVLIVIGVPSQVLLEIPKLLQDYQIKAVIFPVENGIWINPVQQFKLQNELRQYGIQFAFPRPFCSLKLENTTDKSIIDQFISQFRIGFPQISLTTKNERIVNARIIQSAPCGATYYITQFLRNEQLNSWNRDPLEKRISISLNQYPCTASNSRDPMLQAITKIVADNIAHKSMEEAFKNSKISDEEE